ncbi:MAG: hypothetical protein ACE5KJ_01975 [Candidatus Zixiibacteriota bacterium]
MKLGIRFVVLFFALLFLTGVSYGADVCETKVKCLSVAGCCSLTTSFCDVAVGEWVTITFFYIENGVLRTSPDPVYARRATPGKGTALISQNRLNDYQVQVRVDSVPSRAKKVHLWVYLNTGEHVGVNLKLQR